MSQRLPRTDVNQLSPSPKFNVVGNLIDGPTRNYSGGPVTLEDYFTTAHQSLLAVLGAFSKDILFGKIAMPVQLSEFAHEVTSKVEKSKIVRLTLNNAEVSLRLNVPMRNHSIVFDITYNAEDQKYTLACQFIRSMNRGQVAIDYAKMWGHQVDGKLLSEDNTYDRTEFEIELPHTVLPRSIAEFIFHLKENTKAPVWQLTPGALAFLQDQNPSRFKDIFELAHDAGVPSDHEILLSRYVELLKRGEFSRVSTIDGAVAGLLASGEVTSPNLITELIGGLVKHNLTTTQTESALAKASMETGPESIVMKFSGYASNPFAWISTFVEQGRMLAPAARMAQIHIFGDNRYVRNSSFEMLLRLVELKSEAGLEAATEVVSKALLSQARLDELKAADSSFDKKDWYCAELGLMASLLEANRGVAEVRRVLAQDSSLLAIGKCYGTAEHAIARIQKIFGTP